jgi:Flp pilus assembly protein TadB
MGIFEYNMDSDSLRAVGHVRLHIRAGRGLESIIHALAQAELGTVSEALKEPLVRMQAGEATDQILQEAVEKSEHKAFRELISALMLEGDAAIERLEELSSEIQGEKKTKTEAYGESLGGSLTMIAIIFLGSFPPIFLKILELIPPNALLPSIMLPPGFYRAYYVVLCGVLTIAFSSLRYRG